MENRNVTIPLDPKCIQITDPFWKRYMELVKNHVVPYQWRALNDQIPDAEPSHCMKNFRMAAGLEDGEFQGKVFQDSDFAKWVEAVAYVLMYSPDPELEKTADQAINLLCAAQQPDGYLNTYYSISGLDKRWTNLMDNHELYCLGHLIEGAVAYYQATGKRKLLDVVIRYVNHVDTIFGPEEGKRKGYPGHEVIEMALIRLYGITKEEKHLRLAKYFIDQRGQKPLYFEEECKEHNNNCIWSESPLGFGYYQADEPVREQRVAKGHAVRGVYLYSGMADVARVTGDLELLEACERLWDNIVNRHMYITGAIGSSAYGESFTYDYDLPNDLAYAETCASIGLIFFARRMLEITPASKYADVMERALYNSVISGISLDGQSFFYVNPLEAYPKASEKDHRYGHVKVERQKWFDCACCPTNVARLLSSIGSYAYTVNDESVYMHLYIGGNIGCNVAGEDVGIRIETAYPWEEDVLVSFRMEHPTSFRYGIRIPGWAENVSIQLNGERVSPEPVNGYAVFDREWKHGDRLELCLPMPITVLEASEKIRKNIGLVSVCRGPLVYCVEEADNGPDLHLISLGEAPDFQVCFDKNLLSEVNVITSHSRIRNGQEQEALYHPAAPLVWKDKGLRWIPYYAWANRGAGEMRIWINR